MLLNFMATFYDDNLQNHMKIKIHFIWKSAASVLPFTDIVLKEKYLSAHRSKVIISKNLNSLIFLHI